MSRILLPKFERFRAVVKDTPKWTDKNSLYYKLPEHYKKRHREFLSTVPKAVHYRKSEKLYEVDHETGTKKMLQDAPIDVLYPKQAKLGLWGGEGIIPGYIRPVQSGFRRGINYLSTKLWRPKILKMIFYTEILDKYYALTCTRRTLNLIEEAQGFDNYILKTHEVDLKSDIGMQLKREMLIALAKKETELYPNDKEKQELIFNRYKQFIIPLEEAEWVGLKPWEATTKLKKVLQEEQKKLIKPLKEKYIEETLAKLQSDPSNIDKMIESNLEEGGSTKSKPFSPLIKKIWEENKPKFLKK